MLEGDEIYRPSENLTAEEIGCIQKFINTQLPGSEWEEFSEHCKQNQLNPYREVKEAIISAYVTQLLLYLNRKNMTSR